jgi:hypothetical protein
MAKHPHGTNGTHQSDHVFARSFSKLNFPKQKSTKPLTLAMADRTGQSTWRVLHRIFDWTSKSKLVNEVLKNLVADWVLIRQWKTCILYIYLGDHSKRVQCFKTREAVDGNARHCLHWALACAPIVIVLNATTSMLSSFNLP